MSQISPTPDPVPTPRILLAAICGLLLWLAGLAAVTGLVYLALG
jgi:hypothetical protein